jgi:leucyl aminopeptidase
VEFDPVPSVAVAGGVRVAVADAVPASATVLAVPVADRGPVPELLGLDRDALAAAGFDGRGGQTLALPRAEGPLLVAVGIGDLEGLDATALRDAGAAFARAAGRHRDLAALVFDIPGVTFEAAGQAIVEGVLLARYGYDALRRTATGTPVAALTLVAFEEADGLAAGAERGRVLAEVGGLARDLVNTPHSHLNATRLGEVAVLLGASRGFVVELFDRDALVELGCGGLLAVNAGSVEPPWMVKLTYAPAGATGHLTLVGKGVMYDSGGLSLKPSDPVHAQMKNDMSGAAAVLAAFTGLAELGCTTAVTGYLMCTDNMPSGSAMALGDVITIRGGTTVEVLNTDAEGRLVMADALVLACEEGTDAIVDIATLTGACMRALGTEVAGVFGNHQGLVDQVVAAATATDEPVWQLPLDRRLRPELDSPVADIKNLGGANAGATTAALFLAEFVGDVPWAHLDIAGTAMSTASVSWHTTGGSGFGARLLAELACAFRAP